MAVARVVILNWNGAEVLPRFLPSVVEGTPPEVEIVVVDNGSTDRSTELIEQEFPSVRLIRLERNYGFAGGYNRGLAMLDEIPDYYILLNSDIQTPEGWCEPLIELLDRNPDVAAVAPKLLSFTDRNSFEYAGASGGFIDLLGYPFCRGRIMGSVEHDTGQYDDPREVFWATGACFACRSEVFRELGGFDEAFFAHQEEIDLSWRMWLSGWRVMVEPRSVVYHLGAGTLPPSSRKLYLNYRNNLAMLYKNVCGEAMWTVMAVRGVLNFLSATVYLMRGERDNFVAVMRAHRDFCRMRRGKHIDAGDGRKGGQSGGERKVGERKGEEQQADGQNAEERQKSLCQTSEQQTSLRQTVEQQTSLCLKRRETQSARVASPRGIYRGSILLRYFFGKRRFGNLRVK